MDTSIQSIEDLREVRRGQYAKVCADWTEVGGMWPWSRIMQLVIAVSTTALKQGLSPRDVRRMFDFEIEFISEDIAAMGVDEGNTMLNQVMVVSQSVFLVNPDSDCLALGWARAIENRVYQIRVRAGIETGEA